MQSGAICYKLMINLLEIYCSLLYAQMGFAAVINQYRGGNLTSALQVLVLNEIN